MTALKKLVKGYDKLEEVILVALIVTSVLLLFANVLLRYCFNSSIYGVDEITRIIFIWVSWLGVSIGERKSEHITIDLLSGHLHGMPKKVLSVINNLLMLAILVALCWLGMSVTFKYARMGGVSPVWHVKNWFIYLSVPFGCSIMTLRVIGKCFKSFFPESAQGGDHL